MSQRWLKFGIGELVARLVQSMRGYAGAGEQQSIGHFAKSKPGCEGRHGEQGWPAEDSTERFGEFAIGDRMRGNRVDGAMHLVILERCLNGADYIVQRDPTHVLVASSNHATSSELERPQHFFQCSALIAEDHANARLNNTDSCIRGSFIGKFPLLTNLGQEVRARGSFLTNLVCSRVSVIANGRSGYEYRWFVWQAREGFGQQAGAFDAAVTNLLFDLIRPAASDIFSTQVYHRVDAIELGSFDRTARGMPVNLSIVIPDRTAHHWPNLVAFCLQRFNQSRTNQTGRSCDSNLHAFYLRMFLPGFMVSSFLHFALWRS